MGEVTPAVETTDWIEAVSSCSDREGKSRMLPVMASSSPPASKGSDLTEEESPSLGTVECCVTVGDKGSPIASDEVDDASDLTTVVSSSSAATCTSVAGEAGGGISPSGRRRTGGSSLRPSMTSLCADTSTCVFA